MKLFNPNSPQVRVSTPPIVAQIPPPTSGPRALQYPIGTIWIDSITNIVYVLTSFADGEAVWVDTVPASAGVLTSLTVNPGPTAITGEFRVNATVNEAEVIRLHENGGPAGTIEIASLQGTGSDSISIQSVGGGIQIATDAASGDIAITSTLGSIPISSGENIPGAIELSAEGGANTSMILTVADGTDASSLLLNSDDGGVRIVTNALSKDIGLASTLGSINIAAGEDVADAIFITAAGGSTATMAFQNLSGTNAASSPATAAIHILADAGGVGVNAALDFNIVGDTASTIEVTTGDLNLITDTADIIATATLGDINLTADAGDINIEATAGALNFTTGGGISYSVTGAINLDATATSHFQVTGASQDLQLESSGGSVHITATEVATDAIVINASSGGMNLSAVGDASLVTTGGGNDINIQSTSSKVALNAGSGTVDAIVLDAFGVSGGIDINAGTGGIAVDTTGVLSLDAAGVTNLTTTGAFDLTVNSTAGSVVINGGEAVDDAIQLTAGNAAGGVRIASGAAGTGGVTLVGGTTGNIKLTNVQVAAAAGPSATVTVVNNSRVGSCTFSGYTQAASATLVLTLTNSFITATSPVIASVQNAGTNDAQMQITRIKQGSGTADITIKNQGAAALNGDMVMSFIVLA